MFSILRDWCLTLPFIINWLAFFWVWWVFAFIVGSLGIGIPMKVLLKTPLREIGEIVFSMAWTLATSVTALSLIFL
jgi:hypothetical protein